MTLKREKIVLTALVGLAATGTLLVQQEATVAASPYTSGLESATSTNQKQIVVNLVDDAGNPVTWFQADGTNGGSSIEYAGQDGKLEGMQLIALPAGVTATGVTSSDQGQIAMVQGGQLYVTLSAIQGSVAHFTLTGAAFASSNPASSAATDPGSVAPSASSAAPSASFVQVSHSASGASSVVTTPTAVPSSVVTSSSSAVILPSDTTSEVASETPVVPNVPAQSSITVAPSQSVASSASETSDSATVTPSSVNSSAASAPASMAAVAASDTVVQSEATPVASQSNGATQVILPALATQPAAIVNLPKMATTITPTKQIDWQAPTSASAVIDAAAALQQPAQATPVSVTSPASAKSSAQPSAKRDQPNDTTVVKKGSLLSSTADAPKPSMWNDKARTFSALSVGMSALAVAAQMLLSKLTIFKNLLQ
ncbi:hypothetical protein PKU16_08480 [Weissella cibaria]|uniref:hypothetical protein n=1 Tax=Weissella cibaria TaxID=137591 RepID=UPI0007064BAC|nr:hypothetical protein [Weissella cibaria]ALI32860.1 hypothetical protein AO080_05055 [Weissella cibaria]WCE24452.1 hypothetical protein PKU16_08480 [Weissella cibaria]WCE26640.1 hypothetical protein PKU15_08480 [Weissella cibaria]HCU09483.1 hypothetical protein [Weissella cibaria]